MENTIKQMLPILQLAKAWNMTVDPKGNTTISIYGNQDSIKQYEADEAEKQLAFNKVLADLQTNKKLKGGWNHE